MLRFPNGVQTETMAAGEKSPGAEQIIQRLDAAEDAGVRWHVPVLMAADFLLLTASVYGASLLTGASEHPEAGIVLAACWLAALAVSRMYEPSVRRAVMRIFDCARALFLGGIIGIAATFFINPAWFGSRAWYLLAYATATLSCGLGRVVILGLIPRSTLKRRVAVFGTVAQVVQIMELLRRGRSEQPRFCLVAGVVCNLDDDISERIMRAEENFATWLNDRRVDLLVIPAGRSWGEEVTRRLGECDAAGIRVSRFEAAYEELTEKAPVFNVGPDWIAGLESVHRNRYSQRPKRQGNCRYQ